MTLASVPAPQDCVLRYVLERRAAEMPDKTFAVFGDGEEWTYAETLAKARVTANALRGLGVRQGDHVLVWLPNGADCIKVWFAINYVGATYVPINTAYRGRILEHVVANADATVAVVHAELLPRLAEIDRARLARVVVLHGEREPIDGLELLPANVLDTASSEPPPLDRPIAPWDTQSIIFTSGTTGPSKGVLSSYCHLHATTEGFVLIEPGDRHLVNLPMFHVGGTVPVNMMLCVGGSIALVDSFNTDNFWPTIRRTGTTAVILLGVMAGFLMKRPDSAEGKGSSLRVATVIPLDEDGIAFGERFGVTTMTLFNMTEVSCPLISEANPKIPAMCGRPRSGVQVRIVDDNDCEVPVGQVGELIVRTDRPWALNSGYNKNPEATARAWRNGWFHTGDAFRMDQQGNYFFVDRMKDAIRRRGENISSFEVEAEVCAHPAVREAAAVAVPGEVAEDEVLVAISLAQGKTLDPAELIEFLRPRMAHFMIPRYVRILDDLPHTPTQKVQKHLLRGEGVTADTWDREKAGIVVKRKKLRS